MILFFIIIPQVKRLTVNHPISFSYRYRHYHCMKGTNSGLTGCQISGYCDKKVLKDYSETTDNVDMRISGKSDDGRRNLP